MAERNVIVRKLPSVETLGCTSVICTDKTGTLTSNQMTSVSLVLLETTENGIELVEHEITGSSYNPFGSAVGIDRSETVRLPNGAVKDACDIMTLCNDARLIGNDVLADNTEKKNSSGGSTTQQYSIEGEPTEAALLVLVEKLGSISADADESPSTAASLNNQLFSSRYERYATLEFDSKRKSMSVLCSSTVDNQNKLFVKGAPSMLLRRCSHAKLRDGKVVPLTPQLRSQIEDEISSIGDRALRCIGLAFKDDSLVPQLQNENHQYNDYLKDSSIFEVIESDLVFVGITAIRDPPRDGVAESIDLCKQAGIRVVMITGDSKSTSVAIAKDVHIFKENHEEGTTTSRAYEGREFFALPEAEQFDVLKSGNLVICRAEPSDKQRLVKMLQSIDEIPA
jgi:Ca2+-transporting ATPase